MFYNHMVLSDNTIIHPAYMGKESRIVLKRKLDSGMLKMHCGCSTFSDTPLEYGISADARFIPLHQHYVHNPLCVRGNSTGKRKEPYQTEDDGTAKVFLNFNIRNFTIPKVEEEEETPAAAVAEETETTVTVKKADEKESKEKKEKADNEKEPFDSLSNFILRLNTDTYKERVAAGKGLLSADYFLSALTARTKKVYIDGVSKPLRELATEKDGYSFFYSPLVGIETGDATKLVLRGWNKDYSQFLFGATLKREMKLFQKRYGIELTEALGKYRIMAAGFSYLYMSNRQSIYRTIGRLHIFIVNDNGLYCRNLKEVEELNAVSAFLRNNLRYKTTQFHRTVDDDRIFGILTTPGKKQILLCKPKVPRSIAMMGQNHIAVGTEEITVEFLEQAESILTQTV